MLFSFFLAHSRSFYKKKKSSEEILIKIMTDKNEELSDDEEVKSNTLIKFESTEARQFKLLIPAAVDLKRPPSNWFVI
jgi:hypothetical protein